MSNLQGGLIGCGFFAPNHLHAWQEVQGAEITAVCDLDEDKALACSQKFGVGSIYTNVGEMLDAESLDFIDIVTQPATHHSLVEAAVSHGLPVICQKPLAPSLAEARAIIEACRDADVPLMVHENFRWQRPMRALKDAVDELGELFFGRISFRSAYDVYADQPYLAEDERFIIHDLGIHLLDLCRFFMGKAEKLYCQTQRVNPEINGEDTATIMLEMTTGATCVVEVSYASKLERELFPQTLVHLEGVRGSATLGADHHLTVVKEGEFTHDTVKPRTFPWNTPPFEALQDSVVSIQQHWVECLSEGREPETSGVDNLQTIELVFGAYASADAGAPYKEEVKEHGS